MALNMKHKEIHIPKKEEGKPFDNCKLNREPYADVLTNIVQNSSDGFVLAIDNKWGTGKTTFVKMWQQKLENQEYKTLYFNAWKNDFEKDVLVALISEFEELKNSKTEKLFKEVVRQGAPIAKKIGLIAAKSFIDNFVGDGFSKNALNTITKATVEGFESEIKSYTDRKEGIEAFRKSLENFVNEASSDKPVVCIIDELDRCRPNYAVEVLEQIKHLFSVKGIVFVLSIDKEQLGHAVRGVYGSEQINAEEYLRRFIDIEYSIPEPDTKLFCRYLYEYFDFNSFIYSPERNAYSNVFLGEETDFIEFAPILFEHYNLTLRDQEKIFSHARIALLAFKENEYLIPHVFILLIFLRSFENEIYLKIKNKEYSLQELVDKIEDIIAKKINKDNMRLLIDVEVHVLVFYSNERQYTYRKKELFSYKENKEKGTLIVNSKIDKLNYNEIFSKTVYSIAKEFDEHSALRISHFLDKIELTKPFNS